jgi:hypothetical protein
MIYELKPTNYSGLLRLCYHLSWQVHFQGEKWSSTERLLGLHDGDEKERKGRTSRNQFLCEESNERRHIP